MTYICKGCGKEFEQMPNDNECPCGLMVFKKETVQVDSAPQNPKISGENGLGIIVMDFSSSMEMQAFPKEIEYTKSKASVVASALKTSLPLIKNMNKADKAYVAMIGFTSGAKFLGIFKAKDINISVEYWNDWFKQSIRDVYKEYGDGTDISKALKLARELYDGALNGDLSYYGIPDFAPMYQQIVIAGKVHDVANIRVFVYSDGECGGLTNYFEGASVIPGETNVSGVTSAFLGEAESEGFETMAAIAGVCPNHGIKAVIHINQSKNYEHLRELFHMTSGTSGFCVECAKKGKTIG